MHFCKIVLIELDFALWVSSTITASNCWKYSLGFLTKDWYVPITTFLSDFIFWPAYICWIFNFILFLLMIFLKVIVELIAYRKGASIKDKSVILTFINVHLINVSKLYFVLIYEGLHKRSVSSQTKETSLGVCFYLVIKIAITTDSI